MHKQYNHNVTPGHLDFEKFMKFSALIITPSLMLTILIWCSLPQKHPRAARVAAGGPPHHRDGPRGDLGGARARAQQGVPLQDREQDQGVLPPPRHPLNHHPDRVLLHRRQVSTSGYQPRVPTCVCPGRGSARSRVPGTRPRAPRTPRAWRTAAARTSPPSWRSCPSCEAVLNITQI